MERKEFNDIGSEIRNAVQDAIASMDFTDLPRQITDSVNDALNEIQSAIWETGSQGTSRGASQEASQRTSQSDKSAARRQADREQERAREAARQRAVRGEERARAAAAGKTQQTAAASGRTGQQTGQRQRAGVIASRPKGNVSSVLFTVFGSVLLGLGVLLALLFGTIAMTGDIVFGALLVILGLVITPVTGGGIWMLVKGATNRGRLERFRTYVSRIQDKNYLKISDLAAAVHKPEKFVVKDLKKMIELGMFPQGHISKEQNLFILDHATYAEYETMRQEVESKSRAMQAETREQQQLRETVERGQSYLAAIRKANDAIPGEEISDKLFRLEKAVDRIYVQIQKSPEKLPQLRRFQEYYLPTTLKLVETYREFDAQPIAGENITTAKKEIEESLDSINQAFDKLFDSLFADTAMDVSADISVLQTLLAQEGLTQETLKAEAQPQMRRTP